MICVQRLQWASAKHWCGEAAALGNPRAEVALGIMYLDGKGVTRNPARGAALVGRAAARGLPAAEAALGGIYASGVGLPRSYASAARWYRRAAVAGYHGAYFGACTAGIAKGETAGAERWCRAAAAEGSPDAALAMAVAHVLLAIQAHAKMRVGFRPPAPLPVPPNATGRSAARLLALNELNRSLARAAYNVGEALARRRVLGNIASAYMWALIAQALAQGATEIRAKHVATALGGHLPADWVKRAQAQAQGWWLRNRPPR